MSEYLIPKDLNDIVLTSQSSISTEIYKLNPELNITILSKGSIVASVNPANNISKIIRNERLFNSLSKYKRRKLMWTFCKAACSSKIKILSRLNEERKDDEIKTNIEKMRVLDKKLKELKSREEMMGVEGNVAKIFYSSLRKLGEEFSSDFKSRGRYESGIVNSLMNFGHTILRNKIKNRLTANNISSCHSFLHKEDGYNDTLVFDFSEFWLAQVDKIIFYSINKGIIKLDEIKKDGKLKETARLKIIELISSRIENKNIDIKIKEFKGFLKSKNNFSWCS